MRSTLRYRRHLIVVLAGLAAHLALATATRAQESLIAHLDGTQVVPPVTTTATGTARFTLLGDSAIQFAIEVEHLRNAWTAGLYTGERGTSGFKAAILWVGPNAGETNGELAKGTVTGADLLAAAGVSLRELMDRMRKQGTYVQVLTGDHPSGEIRGQVGS